VSLGCPTFCEADYFNGDEPRFICCIANGTAGLSSKIIQPEKYPFLFKVFAFSMHNFSFKGGKSEGEARSNFQFFKFASQQFQNSL
jgi:hypothetical protein